MKNLKLAGITFLLYVITGASMIGVLQSLDTFNEYEIQMILYWVGLTYLSIIMYFLLVDVIKFIFIKYIKVWLKIVDKLEIKPKYNWEVKLKNWMIKL